MRFSLLVLFLPFFFSCDKIDYPYERTSVDTSASQKDTVVVRKILIEDYTGFKCGNCPAASKTARQLEQQYKDKIIIVGIHSGYFAKPKNGKQGEPYTTDLRTVAGEAYNTFWGIDLIGSPQGTANRNDTMNNSIIISPSAWGTAVELLKDIEAEIKIKITTKYDSANRILNTTVNNGCLKTLYGTHNIVLYFVEDSVIDWQLDYSKPQGQQDVKDYVHRYMLRDNINGTWGDELFKEKIAAGDSIIRNYNYTLKNNWKAEHCSVVAYIYNVATYEIIQTEEKKIFDW